MLGDFQAADWAGLVLLVAIWIGYGRFADALPQPLPAGRPRNLNAAMHRVRRQWMRRMVKRHDRIVDVVLTGHTVNSLAFFASSSMIVIAGLVGTLGSSGSAFRVLESLGFAQPTSQFVFQAKLVGLIAIFAIAFYKFTWALRQYNFLCALIGAAPLPEAHPTPEATERFADHAARMLSLALTSFNGGIRAFYFAVAWLAWFIHPYAFIAATALMTGILIKRQLHSGSQAAVEAYLEVLERS
ncbi:MAG TPA: DUF599 domain-containing protein [Dongiaceae bacterium]|jgi:uncharacterized membrane protein|nr:DUF599 domain-containing protein [Dongiaceae bacterium]